MTTYRVKAIDNGTIDIGTFDSEAAAFEAERSAGVELNTFAWVETTAGDTAEPDWSHVPITTAFEWKDCGDGMRHLVNGKQYVGHVSWFTKGSAAIARYNPEHQGVRDLVMRFEGGTEEQRIASAAAWLAAKAKEFQGR